MSEFDNKKLELLEMLIDDRCEMYGIRNTISLMVDNGFTREELLEMKFDEEDVDAVLEDPEACWDLQ